jgi:hypothetical protein
VAEDEADFAVANDARSFESRPAKDGVAELAAFFRCLTAVDDAPS